MTVVVFYKHTVTGWVMVIFSLPLYGLDGAFIPMFKSAGVKTTLTLNQEREKHYLSCVVPDQQRPQPRWVETKSFSQKMAVAGEPLLARQHVSFS